ncbi:protein FAR1-RELATED SEQUENCE 5-like [Setaria viridis]|uniref:protein FAR1-RELATED SEQUENCE 5-like n=1 Tax=Setaria viridis TaxID=4556 RepID=UPI0014933ADD|nr:protein FAR1-RELATED SEQUENCE 5-like [Setaria viridis]XP_034600642.1 protein FAR1-RELATED SEQUENCE 5-like [Setaria viridis]XP_034600643.1 protein FAR1-RELATED SEQUENCE 5-like [Setaria viridis]
MEEEVKAVPHDSNIETLPSLAPYVGMEFRNSDEAWAFWLSYGGQKGFEVRKRYTNKRPSDGTVTSCRFVCAKEGHRLQDKRDHLIKRHRIETRTDCEVHMSLKMDRNKGNYKVTELVLEHNHILHLPEILRLMMSQKKTSDLQVAGDARIEPKAVDDAEIGPKVAHELASCQVGGSLSLSSLQDHTNYLPTKRQREMAYGQAGSMLKYFQDKIAENPSFQYVLQMDCEEQIANIFWVDAKMIMDYAHFGDVFSFDTTFGTDKENRPFGVFVGFNHFRETVVFGAALMYDETFESFKWLFETFLKVHNGKQPKTIYTDQDSAMGKAVAEVFVEAWHGLCTFHIMQNAAKHLHAEKNEDTSILSDFSACMFEYVDMAEFEHKFDIMRKKVSKQTWLDGIYKLKEKWAECYMKDVFTLGMRRTQLNESESLNNDLKIHFKSDFDIIKFFKHFERVVQGKRDNELNSEFDSRKNLPKICMKRPPPILVQASKLYTPIIFEAFQGEYEKSLAACTKALEGDNEYLVGDFTFKEEYKVIGDPLKQTVLCSCRHFDRTGILCAHALKVLDLMNIKLLPPQYVLKRWTWEAWMETIQDNQGRNITENPMDAMLRYKFMSHKFLNLAHRAATFPECFVLVDSALDILGKQIEDKINECTVRSDDLFAGELVFW